MSYPSPSLASLRPQETPLRPTSPAPPYEECVPQSTEALRRRSSTHPGSSQNASNEDPIRAPSAFRPRVAVILGVDRRYHVPLLLSRAFSTAPAAYWGLKCAWVLASGYYFSKNVVLDYQHVVGGYRLYATEVSLAAIWCAASAYLSFFFTDCLMNRWLLNYAPLATLLRLVTINLINVYVASWVVYLFGGTSDTRLLLPIWIFIATLLTVLYHWTQRKSNIKRETSAAIRVFWITSFFSTCSLVCALHFPI